MEVKYTLGKTERLKSRKVIEQLFKDGKSFTLFPLRMVWKYQPIESTILQGGFTVSSKHFKRAVARNRIKRLMKEAYRLQKGVLQTQLTASKKPLAVFFIYVGKEIPEYNFVYEKIGMILERLLKITNDNSKANP